MLVTAITQQKKDETKYNVFIDGEQVGVVTHLSETLSEGTLLSVMLEAGDHSVTLKKSWGWIQLDKMIIRKSAGVDDEIYNGKFKIQKQRKEYL